MIKQKPTEQTVQNKIKSLWESYKKDNDTTQAEMGRILGMNQSAFAQYIRGKDKGGLNPNPTFILKFASAIGVDPATIDDRLGIWDDKLPKAKSIVVKGSTIKNSAYPSRILSELQSPYEDQFLIKAEGALYPENMFFVCSNKSHPEIAKKVAKKHDGYYVIYTVSYKNKQYSLTSHNEAKIVKSLDGFHIVLGCIYA